MIRHLAAATAVLVGACWIAAAVAVIHVLARWGDDLQPDLDYDIFDQQQEP